MAVPHFMQEKLFDHINIKPENTFVPNGCAADLAAECAEYDARIERLGGIDLQLLGIGIDGHIGFNEPSDVFDKATHVVGLHESTIKANSRFFESENDVPKQAVTMGMGAIMQAKKIVLVANGAQKKNILKNYSEKLQEARAKFEESGDWKAYDETMNKLESEKREAINKAKNDIFGDEAWRIRD